MAKTLNSLLSTNLLPVISEEVYSGVNEEIDYVLNLGTSKKGISLYEKKKSIFVRQQPIFNEQLNSSEFPVFRHLSIGNFLDQYYLLFREADGRGTNLPQVNQETIENIETIFNTGPLKRDLAIEKRTEDFLRKENPFYVRNFERFIERDLEPNLLTLACSAAAAMILYISLNEQAKRSDKK